MLVFIATILLFLLLFVLLLLVLLHLQVEFVRVHKPAFAVVHVVGVVLLLPKGEGRELEAAVFLVDLPHGPGVDFPASRTLVLVSFEEVLVRLKIWEAEHLNGLAVPGMLKEDQRFDVNHVPARVHNSIGAVLQDERPDLLLIDEGTLLERVEELAI